MKKPPFGKHIRPHANGVWVCVGAHAWEDAYAILRCYQDRQPLVLPKGEEPDAFIWPVAMDDVVIQLSSEQSPRLVYNLGVALIRAGAARVVAIGATDNLPRRLTLFLPNGAAT